MKCFSRTFQVVTERISIIYPISTLASIFVRFEFSWLQRVG